MYFFSSTSRSRLLSCNAQLIQIFSEVIKEHDCTILCGHRNKEAQDDAYMKDLSKLRYPHSLHNKVPSMAVDAAPYPIRWLDIPRFYYFAGYVMGIARSLDIPLKWGGSWETFQDLCHYELSI